MFSINAVTMNVIVFVQCLCFERGDQKVRTLEYPGNKNTLTQFKGRGHDPGWVGSSSEREGSDLKRGWGLACIQGGSDRKGRSSWDDTQILHKAGRAWRENQNAHAVSDFFEKPYALSTACLFFISRHTGRDDDDRVRGWTVAHDFLRTHRRHHASSDVAAVSLLPVLHQSRDDTHQVHSSGRHVPACLQCEDQPLVHTERVVTQCNKRKKLPRRVVFRELKQQQKFDQITVFQSMTHHHVICVNVQKEESHFLRLAEPLEITLIFTQNIPRSAQLKRLRSVKTKRAYTFVQVHCCRLRG